LAPGRLQRPMLSVVFAYIMMQSLNVELVSYRSNVYSSSVDHEIKQEIANIFYYFYSCYDISERNESFIPFYPFTLRQECDNSKDAHMMHHRILIKHLKDASSGANVLITNALYIKKKILFSTQTLSHN